MSLDHLLFALFWVGFVPIALLVVIGITETARWSFLLAMGFVDHLRGRADSAAEANVLASMADTIAWSSEVKMRSELEWGLVQDRGGFREIERRIHAHDAWPAH